MADRVELRHNTVVKITAGHQVGDDSRTRDLVARSILENGPSTAAVLGERLGLTPAGIRRHLDLLVADGVLEAREPRSSSIRGRGRPSKVFVMSDKGRETFEHSYDDLAVAALKFMSAQSGEHLVNAFAQSRADDIERKATVVLAFEFWMCCCHARTFPLLVFVVELWFFVDCALGMKVVHTPSP